MNEGNKIQHLAIIMDGNRRWATERGLPKLLGHTEGAKTLRKIAQAVADREIPYLTLYTLSTENLKNRSNEELKHLFSLFAKMTDYLEDFIKNNARLRLIGDVSKLPDDVQKSLQSLVEKTKGNTKFTLTLAINYGGRDEIVRAVQKIVRENPGEITEDTITNALDTASFPDVDLVIRTAGDQRLSGFLPWQTVYAELYFTPVKWPAFSEKDLDEALQWFNEQKRNRGG